MVFEQNKKYKLSNRSGNMVKKNIISLISTCSYRKIYTKYENLRTPSFSAHHSCSRFVKIGKGIEKSFFLLASVIDCQIRWRVSNALQIYFERDSHF